MKSACSKISSLTRSPFKEDRCQRRITFSLHVSGLSPNAFLLIPPSSSRLSDSFNAASPSTSYAPFGAFYRGYSIQHQFLISLLIDPASVRSLHSWSRFPLLSEHSLWIVVTPMSASNTWIPLPFWDQKSQDHSCCTRRSALLTSSSGQIQHPLLFAPALVSVRNFAFLSSCYTSDIEMLTRPLYPYRIPSPPPSLFIQWELCILASFYFKICTYSHYFYSARSYVCLIFLSLHV